MVNINSGAYHGQLERMGDVPGDNLGRVTIFTVGNQKIVADSSDITLLENHSVSAKDVDGRVWFFSAGTYWMADHADSDDDTPQPVTSGGR